MLPNVFAKGNKKTQVNLVELRKEAMADKAPRVALRIQGVLLSIEKHRVSEIAHLLKVHRATVHNWIQQWNAFREVGLLEGHRAGRPTLLTEEDRQRLHDIVDSGPVASDFLIRAEMDLALLGRNQARVKIIVALVSGWWNCSSVRSWRRAAMALSWAGQAIR